MAIFNKSDEENATKSENKGNPTGLSKVKKHNTLGEYKNVIVHPTRHALKNSMIFVSIGLYTAEFRPETEISLPQGIIDFLKTATAVTHEYDVNATSENGNKGAHISRPVKKYVVETV